MRDGVAGRDVAVIVGNHLNAYGIYQSLRSAGWEGRVAFVTMSGTRPGYEMLVRDAETWSVSLGEPAELVGELGRRLGQGARAVIFLTDERFHETLLQHRDRPELKDARFYLGPKSKLDVVLDRYAFYRFLETGLLCGTPCTIDGGADPWKAFGGPFIFRFRRSWDGLNGMERVRIVRAAAEFDTLLQTHRRHGFSEKNWCFQEILSTDPMDNVSVCGWHDGDDQVYRVTRTLARHPPQKGTALVCELVDGHEDLLEATRRILRALDFQGPFELEFVRDLATGAFKAIELNPRFWLQHTLMQQATGYALTLRYLGLPLVPPRVPRKRYWVNTVQALARAPRGDLLAIRHLLGSCTVRAPKLRTAVRYVVNAVMWRLLRRRQER